MINRRNFVKSIPALSLTGMISVSGKATPRPTPGAADAIIPEREYWVDLLHKIAGPVLHNLSRGTLRQSMPVEKKAGNKRNRKRYTHLEAVGRTLSGVAPWLALTGGADAEKKARTTLLDDTLQGLAHAVDPASPDYLNFSTGMQPLVDGAFLSLGFLRAPKALWEPLDHVTRQRVIREIKSQRRIRPFNNNWLLFASINEAFLLSVGEQFDEERLLKGPDHFRDFYLGDGWYGDGPHLRFDYYNGYVIHPMLVQVLKVLADHQMKPEEEYKLALQRMQRYGEEQERLISPEGTYPPIGRSITYRVGAFQPLADLVWKDALPGSLTGGQVRSALTAILKKQFEAEGTFDRDGWLQIGLCGHQPDAANIYISTGSLYLCTNGFLPLGLPSGHSFWESPPEDWSAKKAWNGKSFRPGHAIKN